MNTDVNLSQISIYQHGHKSLRISLSPPGPYHPLPLPLSLSLHSSLPPRPPLQGEKFRTNLLCLPNCLITIFSNKLFNRLAYRGQLQNVQQFGLLKIQANLNP